MRKMMAIVMASMVYYSLALPVESAEVSVRSMQPVVVRTIPEAGATDVDPSTSEIRVTFSKGMRDNSWSWVQVSPETFPKLLGKLRYLKDGRTCAVKVKLEAGRTYVIWFNSQKYRGFVDTDGLHAFPYLLVFETRK
jgi:hypothetical protein